MKKYQVNQLIGLSFLLFATFATNLYSQNGEKDSQSKVVVAERIRSATSRVIKEKQPIDFYLLMRDVQSLVGGVESNANSETVMNIGDLLLYEGNVSYKEPPKTGLEPTSLLRSIIIEALCRLKDPKSVDYLIRFYEKQEVERYPELPAKIKQLGGSVPRKTNSGNTGVNVCLASTNNCFQMEYNPLSVYTPSTFNEMNEKLRKYPMNITASDRSSIIVLKGKSLQSYLYTKDSNDWRLDIILETNSFSMLTSAIDKSFLSFIASSRPNTWSGERDIVKIPEASYVAHYGGKQRIMLCFVCQNIFANIVSDYHSKTPLTREESTQIANKIGDMLFGEFSESEKKVANTNINLSFKKQGNDKAMITWQSKSSSTNNWVRMDASDGVLTIVDDNKVVLEDIDEKNVTVECFEIKQDGSLNAYGKLEVE